MNSQANISGFSNIITNLTEQSILEQKYLYKDTFKYLTKKYKQNQIDENLYSELLLYTISNYVEKLLEVRFLHKTEKLIINYILSSPNK